MYTYTVINIKKNFWRCDKINKFISFFDAAKYKFLLNLRQEQAGR